MVIAATRNKTTARTTAENAVTKSISKLSKKLGFPPSFREVALATDIPVGTVHAICRDLRDRKVISFSDRMARTLKVR